RSLDDVLARGRVALVVGGSPHYLQALIDRLQPAPRFPDLRAWLDRTAAAGGRRACRPGALGWMGRPPPGPVRGSTPGCASWIRLPPHRSTSGTVDARCGRWRSPSGPAAAFRMSVASDSDRWRPTGSACEWTAPRSTRSW